MNDHSGGEIDCGDGVDCRTRVIAGMPTAQLVDDQRRNEIGQREDFNVGSNVVNRVAVFRPVDGDWSVPGDDRASRWNTHSFLKITRERKWTNHWSACRDTRQREKRERDGEGGKKLDQSNTATKLGLRDGNVRGHAYVYVYKPSLRNFWLPKQKKVLGGKRSIYGSFSGFFTKIQKFAWPLLW